MPIYEYQCQSCGHELEKIQRMSDDPLKDCPDCGEEGLRRLVSAAGFRLKGGGWYETDFKKDGKKNLHASHGSGNGTAKDPVKDTSGSPTSDAAKSTDTAPSTSKSAPADTNAA